MIVDWWCFSNFTFLSTLTSWNITEKNFSFSLALWFICLRSWIPAFRSTLVCYSHLFRCWNCPRFGLQEPCHAGLHVLLMCPVHSLRTSLLLGTKSSSLSLYFPALESATSSESWFLSVHSGASEPRSRARYVRYCWGVAAARPFQWVNTNVFYDMLFKVSTLPGDLYVQTWKVCLFFLACIPECGWIRTIFYWWTSRWFSVFCRTVNVECVNHIIVNTTNVSVSSSPWKENFWAKE